MQIEVRLFASFRRPNVKNLKVELPEDATAQDLVTAIEIEASAVGILLVNGRHSQLDRPLQDGDIISLFPLVAGG